MIMTDVSSAQGLDVSNFQGRFDWAGARKRIPDLAFGIYRMTEGLASTGANSPDPDAQWNHDEIGKAGIYHGAYHFLHPHLSGQAQAEYFVSRHQAVGLTSTDMLWLDNENNNGGASGPAAVAACARAFMSELDILAPHNPRGVYTFLSFATGGYCEGLGNRPLWLANPSSTAPKTPVPWTHWSFWQWGTRNGDDADAFNGTAIQLNAWMASWAPARVPTTNGPTKHVSAGLRSLIQIASDAGCQPWQVAAQTVMHMGGMLGFRQRAYFNRGDFSAHLPAGMIYWLP
jgi:GH25 family lysozyme M1 (1,4-beta-N-acetylmuramidase)